MNSQRLQFESFQLRAALLAAVAYYPFVNQIPIAMLRSDKPLPIYALGEMRFVWKATSSRCFDLLTS